MDITIRPLANLWNIESATEEDFRVPTDTEIKTVLEKTGYEAVTIGESQTVTIDKSDMVLDLGAVGKGFALGYCRTDIKRRCSKRRNDQCRRKRACVWCKKGRQFISGRHP